MWEQDFRHKYERAPSPGQRGAALGMASKYSGDWFRKAVGEAALQGNPGNLGYIRGILENWRNAGGPSVEPRGDFERRYLSGPYGRLIET